jgi:hypothetical protein
MSFPKIIFKILLGLSISFGVFVAVGVFVDDATRLEDIWILLIAVISGLTALFFCKRYIWAGEISFSGTIASGISLVRDTKDSISSDLDQQDADLFAQAEKEIDDGKINNGLWSQALVKAKGNEQLRKVEYMKLRVKQIRKEHLPSHAWEPPDSREDHPLKVQKEVDKNAIWNPNATVNWSLPLTPAFGSYLQSINWRVLGNDDKAKGSKAWFYFSLILIATNLVFFEILPSKTLEITPWCWLFYTVIWYYFSGIKQAKHVKDTLADDYSRRPWAKPLIIGFLYWFAYNAAFIIILIN